MQNINIQDGKAFDFGKIFDDLSPKIYNFLYYRTHHKQTAEDLTSTVFTKALERIKQFDAQKAQFSTWLYQIAKNALIDHYRTFKQTGSIDDIWELPSAASVERDVDTALALEKVKEQIKQLPALQRDIIIMRLWDGLSHAEISSVLGITEGNSKVSFSRGIDKLRVEMGILAALFIIGLKSLILNL
ncbi:MAG: sigma-70 family RNA polymerase sigma factor [Patescibacteria group bacterium]